MHWPLCAAYLLLLPGVLLAGEFGHPTPGASIDSGLFQGEVGARAVPGRASVEGELPDDDGADASELSGFIAVEYRHFFHPPLFPGQRSGENLSVVLEPLYHMEWDGGQQDFAFRPYVRIDNLDPNRTHWDIRELEWILARTNWELRLGVRKVFWGVTESQHLVDIINQTDLVENPDGEDKLGQPMMNFALIQDWGTLDFFLMPYFRERTFPGREGRLRVGIPVDTDQAEYARGGGKRTFDWALRWSHYIGNLDFGLSYFHGTGRDPIFRFGSDKNGSPVLIPIYFQIDQIGLDAQLTTGDTLWKLEVIRRAGFGEWFVGGTGGFEHTLYGVWDTAMDVGLLVEYLYNNQNDARILSFENDLFLGVRVSLNDAQSTEVLFGAIQDIDDSGTLYNLEASRRIGQDWKLTLEGRFFTNLPRSHPQYSVRNDDYVSLELAWFF